MFSVNHVTRKLIEFVTILIQHSMVKLQSCLFSLQVVSGCAPTDWMLLWQQQVFKGALLIPQYGWVSFITIIVVLMVAVVLKSLQWLTRKKCTKV